MAIGSTNNHHPITTTLAVQETQRMSKSGSRKREEREDKMVAASRVYMVKLGNSY